jgi:hypothetical protein
MLMQLSLRFLLESQAGGGESALSASSRNRRALLAALLTLTCIQFPLRHLDSFVVMDSTFVLLVILPVVGVIFILLCAKGTCT